MKRLLVVLAMVGCVGCADTWTIIDADGDYWTCKRQFFGWGSATCTSVRSASPYELMAAPTKEEPTR